MSAVIPVPGPDADAARRWKTMADLWQSLAEIAIAQAGDNAAEIKALNAENARLLFALAQIAGAAIDPPDDPDDREAMTAAQHLQHIAQNAYFAAARTDRADRGAIIRETAQ